MLMALRMAFIRRNGSKVERSLQASASYRAGCSWAKGHVSSLNQRISEPEER